MACFESLGSCYMINFHFQLQINIDYNQQPNSIILMVTAIILMATFIIIVITTNAIIVIIINIMVEIIIYKDQQHLATIFIRKAYYDHVSY